MFARDVRWNDFEDLVEMYYRLYEERERGEPIGISLFAQRPSRSDEVAWFSNLYRQVLSGDAVMAVAEDGGRVVGNCVIQREGPSADSETGHVGVLGIVVQRDHRGKGVGTALLTYALAAARGRFEVIRLAVFVTNVRARRLYERFGFVTAGRIPRAVRRGTEYFDEDEMVLLLPPPAPNA
jgi:RimJ/RimL family protein N-acetyltransferase